MGRQAKEREIEFAEELARQCVRAGVPFTRIPVLLLERLAADARTLREMETERDDHE